MPAPVALLVHELMDIFPCFFDLTLGRVKEILGIGSKRLDKIRADTGTADTWSLVSLSRGEFRMTWDQIRDLRAEVSRRSPEHIVSLLLRAEMASVYTRAVHTARAIPPTSAAMLVAVVREPAFHPLPHDVDDLKTKLDIIGQSLPLMIDVPLHHLCRFAAVSPHILRRVRCGLGIVEWPYESIREGLFVVSAADVARRRAAFLEQLDPTCFQARLLAAAASMVSSRKRDGKWTPHASVSVPLPGAGGPLRRAPAAMAVEEVSAPQPQQESPVEQEAPVEQDMEEGWDLPDGSFVSWDGLFPVLDAAVAPGAAERR